jgi:hypothetical protein
MRRTRRVALDVRGLIDRVEIFRLSKGARRDPAVESWLSDEPVELRPGWMAAHMRRCAMTSKSRTTVARSRRGRAVRLRQYIQESRQRRLFYGALLDDPAGLLEGSGKRMRHVKIKPGAALDTRGLRNLIDAAYADIKTRLEE